MNRHLSKRAFLAGCACCGAGALVPARATVSGPGELGAKGLPTMLELGTQPMARLGESVWVARIAPRLWLHTTTAVIPGGVVFPANGLVLESGNGSILIDTGYLPEQAALLLAWSKTALIAPIVRAVATHFHNDRTGGIDGLKALGVPTFASPLTCRLAAEHGLPVPEPLKDFGGAPYRFAEDCELFFPGAGHTRDNIVAWFAEQRVLFGGCLLKSTTSGGLGNVADSVVADWPASIRAMQRRYPSPALTIPGHGTIAGDPVAWTLVLLAKNKT
ncbi:MAG TPA: subclass B1 metallo-beta-lactamase [Rhizomicrobium sp.]|jgi:glyoxylase-like metal-dependent hydrolase (beta-lactamase superfamily II)